LPQWNEISGGVTYEIFFDAEIIYNFFKSHLTKFDVEWFSDFKLGSIDNIFNTPFLESKINS